MEANYFTVLYWFCHTSTWIRHGCTGVPNPEPPSHFPPYTISLGHPSAPSPSILYSASNLDWRFVFYMILYMFQCHSPKSSHLHPVPQSPKDWSIHWCLSFFKNFYFILLYNTMLVLPYIDMNPPQVYTSSQSWIPLPPPTPYHLSGSSPCTWTLKIFIIA